MTQSITKAIVSTWTLWQDHALAHSNRNNCFLKNQKFHLVRSKTLRTIRRFWRSRTLCSQMKSTPVNKPKQILNQVWFIKSFRKCKTGKKMCWTHMTFLIPNKKIKRSIMVDKITFTKKMKQKNLAIKVFFHELSNWIKWRRLMSPIAQIIKVVNTLIKQRWPALFQLIINYKMNDQFFVLLDF